MPKVCWVMFLSAQCVSSIGQIIKSVCVSVCQSLSQWVSESVRKFWDHLHISGSIEARNFKFGKHRLATGGPKRKNTKLGRKGSWSVTWPTFRILGPPPYLGNGRSKELQLFSDRLAIGGRKRKKCKISRKGSWRVTWPTFWNFATPSTVEARNFKFGTQIGHWGS